MLPSQFRIKRLIFSFYIFCVMFGADAFASDDTTLYIPYAKQQKTNWCWAASTSMVLNYYIDNSWIPIGSHIIVGQSISQTRIADYGTPGQPNVGNFMTGKYTTKEGHIMRGVSLILKHFDSSLYTQYYSGTIDSSRARHEIVVEEDPFLLVWEWKNWKGAHMVIVNGYTNNHPEQPSRGLLHIQDPWYGPMVMSYPAMVDSSDRWWRETLTVDQ